VPPGESAAVRVVVAEGELLPANALLAATWSVAFVIGMALGGVAAMLGPALALALDASSFALAAILHGTLPAMPSRHRPQPREVVRATPRDTAYALRVAAADRRLLAAVLGKRRSRLPVARAGSRSTSSRPRYDRLALRRSALACCRRFAARGRHRSRDRGALEPARCGRAPPASGRGRAHVVAIRASRDALTARLTLATLVWGIGTGSNWVIAHASMQRTQTST